MIDVTESLVHMDKKTAVALGVFDGIHLGHQAVIKKSVMYKDVGLSSCVFTFDTKSVTSKADGKLELLISDDLKKEMFEKLGVDYVCSAVFADIKDLSAEEFVLHILKEKLNAGVVICGGNFHFGKGGKAGVTELNEFCIRYNIKCETVPFTEVDGQPVSSTLIRQFIRDGEIRKANEMLGYDFHFKADVTKGNKIGRTLDFPTVNQYFPDRHVVPKFGVYASYVYVNGKKYAGVSNIGIKPTIGLDTKPLCETYIIDFNQDVYGKNITVHLTDFIRPEKKFCNLEELKTHIAQDLATAKKIMNV